jgi:hypothetical protein
MEYRRHRGFIVGSDAAEGRIVWKVRVKDSDSQYDGQKLVVASFHDGLHLARGLNVNFAVGTVDDTSGKKVLRAVDVRIENPDEESKNPKRSGGQQ